MTTPAQEEGVRPVEEVVDGAYQHAVELEINPHTLRKYRLYFRRFKEFAEERGEQERFSPRLVSEFLVYSGITVESGLGTSKGRNLHASMRLLSDFAAYGCYQYRSRILSHVELPAELHDLSEDYARHCAETLKHRDSTIRAGLLTTVRFLYFICKQGVERANEITQAHLSGFVKSRIHLATPTIANTLCCLRSFFKFLVFKGIRDEDLGRYLPRVRRHRDARLPSVWTKEQVDSLLRAVDRGNPRGKRDYAILLLACRMGLRAGDIRALRLDDIDWASERIRIQQKKTGQPLELPLLEEVGEALIDYLKHARPPSDYREIILTMAPPYCPFSSRNSFNRIISEYRCRADIRLPQWVRKGVHALRHSLATRLLEVDTPLEVISGVLGHRNSRSTSFYVKADIATLRDVALDPDEVWDAET